MGLKLWKYSGQTALHKAAEMENLEMIKFLIDKNANMEIRDNRVTLLNLETSIPISNYNTYNKNEFLEPNSIFHCRKLGQTGCGQTNARKRSRL